MFNALRFFVYFDALFGKFKKITYKHTSSFDGQKKQIPRISLRLRHDSALAVYKTAIHYLVAATLPFNRLKGAVATFGNPNMKENRSLNAFDFLPKDTTSNKDIINQKPPAYRWFFIWFVRLGSIF